MNARSMPRLRDLQPALERVTEVFAHALGARLGGGLSSGLNASGASADTGRWSESDWRIARAVASMHGVSGLLARDPMRQALADFHAFVADQRVQTAARHARFSALRETIDAKSRAAGLGLVALKGAALHHVGLYVAGDRPMADLDLLTAPADADRTAELLNGLGFHETQATWKHRSFEPSGSTLNAALGEHANNGLKIELHTQLVERLPRRGVDISPAIFAGRIEPGVHGYASNASLMIHLLHHAAGALVFRAIRLIHLHDIALVAQRMSHDDWDALMSCVGEGTGSGPGFWWAYPPLALTARYFRTIPQPVIDAARRRCHWPLRTAAERQTLTDLSLSNARILALPGIAWARTAAEACAHVRHRLIPDRDLRAMRRLHAQGVPGAAAAPWMHQTQTRRMLRALLGTPVRPETLSAVSAALRSVSRV